MTYNVFSGMLNPTQLINRRFTHCCENQLEVCGLTDSIRRVLAPFSLQEKSLLIRNAVWLQ